MSDKKAKAETIKYVRCLSYWFIPLQMNAWNHLINANTVEMYVTGASRYVRLWGTSCMPSARHPQNQSLSTLEHRIIISDGRLYLKLLCREWTALSWYRTLLITCKIDDCKCWIAYYHDRLRSFIIKLLKSMTDINLCSVLGIFRTRAATAQQKTVRQLNKAFETRNYLWVLLSVQLNDSNNLEEKSFVAICLMLMIWLANQISHRTILTQRLLLIVKHWSWNDVIWRQGCSVSAACKMSGFVASQPWLLPFAVCIKVAFLLLTALIFRRANLRLDKLSFTGFWMKARILTWHPLVHEQPAPVGTNWLWGRSLVSRRIASQAHFDIQLQQQAAAIIEITDYVFEKVNNHYYLTYCVNITTDVPAWCGTLLLSMVFQLKTDTLTR